MKLSACVAVLGVVFAGGAWAQLPLPFGSGPAESLANIKVPEYDVTSVKLHKDTDNNMMFRMMPNDTQLHGVPLQMMVKFAYGIKSDEYISGGPEWINSKRFDVEGKANPADVEAIQKLTPKERRAVSSEMFKKLLVERFGLKVHTVTKELPVYELVVSKGGSKMKEVAPPEPFSPDKLDAMQKGGAAPRGMISIGPGMLTGDSMQIGMLVDTLTQATSRMVVDKTGLKGSYEVHLKWADERMKMAQKDNGSSDAPLPDIYTALQEELGLKLVPAKGRVETLVIDSATLPVED